MQPEKKPASTCACTEIKCAPLKCRLYIFQKIDQLVTCAPESVPCCVGETFVAWIGPYCHLAVDRLVTVEVDHVGCELTVVYRSCCSFHHIQPVHHVSSLTLMSRSIVFVYGTLKRGFFNEKIINTSGASFLRTARTVKAFPLVVGEYGVPYLLPPRQDEGCRIDVERKVHET